MESPDYSVLAARIGREVLAARLLRQAKKTAKLLHQGEGIFRIERFFPFDRIVAFGLNLVGLRKRAWRNYLDVRLTTCEWELPRLSQEFEGFRLLHLSDLHIDLDVALTPVLERLIRSVPHDAAVITGDYRNTTDGDYLPCVREMEKIIGALAPQRWGILGNHDFIEMVPALEDAGLPILLNEVVPVERSGQKLWIAGVDDPHFYKTHDLARARSRVPEGDCVILLSHTPEPYAEAEALGFDLQLSGHTHGGQICLPGGIPVVLPCGLDRKFVRGVWRHGNLQGYTSPGAGGCGVAARLNCPPEITLHILKTSPAHSRLAAPHGLEP
ncbi:MAG: metallophosphoesterase [Chthoniobacterales bacterium]|nr:metallophosphoesterase [Chthoniobacterales bacterium]